MRIANGECWRWCWMYCLLYVPQFPWETPILYIHHHDAISNTYTADSLMTAIEVIAPSG